MKIIVIGVLLACLAACALPGHVSPFPGTIVMPPSIHHENMTALPGAVGVIVADELGGPYTATAGDDGRLVFVIDPMSTGGAWLTVTLHGYKDSHTRLTFCISTCEQPVVVLTPALPPVPTRAQVTAVKLTFQGLTVCTHKFGCLPWFEPAIMALDDPLDRQAVYTAKHAQGDTHLIIQFGKGGLIYGEPPHYQNVCCSPDWEANPSLFVNLVEEIIQNGFTPILTYDGDCGDDPVCGYPNAVRQASILANLLKNSTYGDLNPYVLYFRGWDSVFYGSTPENIQSFGHLFRSLLPTGYLAIEFNTGHIPVGGGPADYAPGGRMTDYDVIMGEFDNWPTVGGAESMILARMLGPAYVPYAGQQPDSAPFYLAPGTPRGPYVFTCFEYGEYGWTHDQTTAAQVVQARQWYLQRGCTSIG